MWKRLDTALGVMERYRLAVSSRAFVAVVGGYVLAAAFAAVGAHAMIAMGVARLDAVQAATMLSFIVHAVAALWAFGCANAWRAWGGVMLPGVALTWVAQQLARGVTA